MTQQQFETALRKLTQRRREVLELFLAGESDQAIAQSLYITESTVRHHIWDISKAFNLKNDDAPHSSQRANLIALFAKYKPELVQEPTVTDIPDNQQDTYTTGETQEIPLSESDLGESMEYDPNFVGRKSAIADIDNLINKGAKVILIQARGGVGKTTLATKYLENKFTTVLEFNIAKETKDIASVESLVEEKLRNLGEEPGREFMVSLDRLKQRLKIEPIGILIDNLEPALDTSGRFIEQHRSYLELLRVLTDTSVKYTTLITSRERLCEGLDITLYRLSSLTPKVWSEYWDYQEIKTDTPILNEIHRAFGGNALAMKVLCEPILNDFQGDIVAYWQENKTEEGLIIETKVENLIKEQFDRLAKINIDAYNLLCRLGCYRYQNDVQTIPESGLNCLLWDVVKNKYKKVIKALKERALVEFKDSEYWLHPVIREEAIERLRNSEDWEKANTQAAEFWTESVKNVQTVKDALTVFEAHYHYLNIKDYNHAAYVISKPRTRKQKYIANIPLREKTPLGIIFYRLGLLEKMKRSIYSIINEVKELSDTLAVLTRLYNILGDLYWMTGELYKAIECHQKSKELAEKMQSKNKVINGEKNIKNLNIVAFFYICLCYIDLWDFEKAINYFQKTISFCQELKAHYRFIENSIIVLAFLYSQINDKKGTLDLVNRMNFNFHLYNESSDWGIGYSYIFAALTYKNLGIIKDSNKKYKEAINFDKKVNYPQLKGKALTGLAELYRIQNDFEKALNHHQESIETLYKIGAKCDLAEAYFQLALTYQSMGDQAKSEEYFNKAMDLWSPEQINAPKQIERVLNAMNGEL
ncbi:MAG: tetratricopeptide repeat protein [Moorea sp. SIO2B7]|nr:tetratricopeptide repeat protein [Moorena sp. SIO2B7]